MAVGTFTKKEIEMQKKTKIILVASGILIGLAAAGIKAVGAYLMDRESEVNKTIVGGNNIEIVEEFIQPDEIKPGTVIHKDVSVKNTGPGACYVRIWAEISNSKMDQYCSVDWNMDDFLYEEGYFYYEFALDEGEQTPSLMTNIVISSELPQEKIEEFSLIVYAESYQAEGFANFREAWDHAERNEP